MKKTGFSTRGRMQPLNVKLPKVKWPQRAKVAEGEITAESEAQKENCICEST
jgi:hypothetical protein